MYKAIIFDLDGTLLDTSRDIHSVLNASLAKFNLPLVTLEKTMQMVGDGAKKLIERAIGATGGELLDKVYKDYSAAFADCQNNLTNLYDGESEALKNFNLAGIKLAIVTNKLQRATEKVVDRFLSEFDFCQVISQSERFPLKPNPTSTLFVIDKMGVKKDECVFVGDGDADALTAKNAGIKCISALWGFRSKNQLKSAGATCFAENFTQLESVVLS